MTYLDQAPTDLTLFIPNKPFDESQFTVLKNLSFETPDVQLKACIIGESHCIQVNTPRHNFGEILACVPSIKCSSYSQYNLTEMVTHNFTPSLAENALEHLSYRIRTDVITGALAKNSQFSTLQHLKHSEGLFMVHDFPTQKGFPFIPITAVSIGTKHIEDTDGKSFQITWSTIHSYPNHNCVVITKSSIRIK